MSDIVKYLGNTLHRVYDAVVQRPMPWRMIDKLSSLEEAEEAQAEQLRKAGIDPDPLGAPAPLDSTGRLPTSGAPESPADKH